jgi:hypothetical protein
MGSVAPQIPRIIGDHFLNNISLPTIVGPVASQMPTRIIGDYFLNNISLATTMGPVAPQMPTRIIGD